MQVNAGLTEGRAGGGQNTAAGYMLSAVYLIRHISLVPWTISGDRYLWVPCQCQLIGKVKFNTSSYLSSALKIIHRRYTDCSRTYGLRPVQKIITADNLIFLYNSSTSVFVLNPLFVSANTNSSTLGLLPNNLYIFSCILCN